MGSNPVGSNMLSHLSLSKLEVDRMYNSLNLLSLSTLTTDYTDNNISYVF